MWRLAAIAKSITDLHPACNREKPISYTHDTPIAHSISRSHLPSDESGRPARGHPVENVGIRQLVVGKLMWPVAADDQQSLRRAEEKYLRVLGSESKSPREYRRSVDAMAWNCKKSNMTPPRRTD